MGTLHDISHIRAKAVAVERATHYIDGYEMPAPIRAACVEALEQQPGPHQIWQAASLLVRQWLSSRKRVQCIESGTCSWCGEYQQRGSEHWCASVEELT